MPASKKIVLSVDGKPVAKPAATQTKKSTSASSTAKTSTPSSTKSEKVGDEDSWSEEEELFDSDLEDFVEEDEEDELGSDEEVDESTLSPEELEELEAIRWLHSYCDQTRKGRLRGVIGK